MTSMAGRFWAHKPRHCGRQHHQAHSHQRAKGLKAGDQVEHDKKQEQKVIQRAATADRAQEAWIKTLGDQRPIYQG